MERKLQEILNLDRKFESKKKRTKNPNLRARLQHHSLVSAPKTPTHFDNLQMNHSHPFSFRKDNCSSLRARIRISTNRYKLGMSV